MTAARRTWALMAVLATIALTSYTVQAILEEGSLSLEPQVTGNAVAEDFREGDEGFSEMIERAAEWVLEAE